MPTADVPNIESLLLISEVSKYFDIKKKPALNRISARIYGGCVTGLVGPDGAGKTTLLRLICGLLFPSSGSISVLGHDTVKYGAEINSFTGYMPQKFGLYEDLTVMENLALYADLRGVPMDKRDERYANLLQITDLAQFTGRLAGKLSGGMKQKLGLACTLLAEPPVLLLDEPGVGVDPVARRELWSTIRGLLSPERIVIWSTAYLDEAEGCDRVLVLNDGEILFDGAPGEMSSLLKGQVFLLGGAGGARRALISPIMQKAATIDAVIQGDSVRVVTGDGGHEITSELDAISQEAGAGVRINIKGAAPRFEDAYIKKLGGAKRGVQSVTDFWQPKEPGVETVRASGLTRRFGDFTAVDNISFSIGSGEIFGLLGPNGAGKSTTFKMICGLLTPTLGECSVAGINFKDAPGKARSRIGYMSQKFSLYGDLSVLQNLNFASSIYGLKGAVRSRKVGHVIDSFDLSGYLGTPAKLLPLGFKQRLAMGCAFMHGPDVLFLDEPTSGVDPVTRREFWTYINSAALLGVTVMVTTHFMDEAEYCDRIALIYRGQMIASGAPDTLKAEVANASCPEPTLEDAFIKIIERCDEEASATGGQ